MPSSVQAPAFAVDENELRLIDLALEEDKGTGDWTTLWIVPARTRAHGSIVAKADGVVSGIAVASAVFLRLDPRAEVTSACSDGDRVKAGDTVLTIKAPARTILTGERTALNFLQRLSGIASMTRMYVDAVEGTGTAILDTRKTTPAWRGLEKAAVRAGGGVNHRFGLFDMVLIKENHIEIAGGVAEAIRRVQDGNEKDLRVEVEVRNKDELKVALESGCDRILLDNMDVQAIREAVRIIRKTSQSVEIEASGNMTLERVRSVAETGVDFISVGALTHSAPALDLSMQMKSV
ncbi:MAG TPA: carboxylating nicotinate-nucleotide diphosphorylase [Longimicrobiales bacterium]